MSSTDAAIQALEGRLGHRFSDRSLVTRALTHRSFNHAPTESYERLEFLGDRVLGMVIADLLLDAFPAEPEGHLSKRFNALVRRETLAEIASELEIGGAILLGQSEDLTGADNPAILADVCEALIAAMYLDGGMDVARRFVSANWEQRLSADPKPPRDPKSTLQEWTMARELGLPDYEIVSTEGPAHAPVFRVRVTVKGHGHEEAEGRAKRQAEQEAASLMLARVAGAND